jgi:hypothetical protein
MKGRAGVICIVQFTGSEKLFGNSEGSLKKTGAADRVSSRFKEVCVLPDFTSTGLHQLEHHFLPFFVRRVSCRVAARS